MWHIGIDLLSPRGTVLLAHPLRLRAMIQRRAKTAKLDAQLLANLLRIDQIPLAYVSPKNYRQLRDLTRCRARLIRGQAKAKINLRALLARQNRLAPYKIPFGPRGLAWFRKQDFGPIENLVRDQLLAQVERFRTAKQVGAYAGLTCRVQQSGSHCYHGSITHEGSPWLRWVLVEAAMHVVRSDVALRNFYTRIRKRSSARIARVATARKLGEIGWKRLRRWHEQHTRNAPARDKFGPSGRLAAVKAKERRGAASVLQLGLIDVEVHAVDSFDFQHYVILDDIGHGFGYTHTEGSDETA